MAVGNPISIYKKEVEFFPNKTRLISFNNINKQRNVLKMFIFYSLFHISYVLDRFYT